MEIRKFRVKVLTPVHIGTGQVLAPEEYTVRDGRLLRFRPELAMRAWSAAERKRFEDTVASGNLREAWSQLRRAALVSKECWLYEIAMGTESRQELERPVDPARRRGEVRCLFWNLACPKVVIPGSAIKGAIRTAVVNAYARDRFQRVNQVVEAAKASPNWRKSNKAWQDLESEALGFRRSDTHADPLHLLSVSDGSVTPSAIRLDQAEVRNVEGASSTRGIQMHYERLLSAADGNAAEFQIELGLKRERSRHPAVAEFLRSELDWDFLISACNAFFAGRREAELALLSFLRAAAGRWAPPDRWWQTGGVLLRIGRFSHFESLSVDGLRDGFHAQRRQGMQEGTSRTVVVLNGQPVPFGWILLQPAR